MYTLQNYSTVNIAYKKNPKGKVFQLHFIVWLEFQTDCLFQKSKQTIWGL